MNTLRSCLPQVKINENNPEEVAVNDGEVAMFRRRLWAEHTSGLSEEEKALLDPSSLSAIRRIGSLADESLKSFVGDKPDLESKSRFMR